MRAKILSILIAIISSFALHAQDASMYLKYANRGDKDAMYNLAGCYWSGNGGVAQDYQSAFNWYGVNHLIMDNLHRKTVRTKGRRNARG